MVWVELELGQKVKMMTLQSNSHRSIGTLVRDRQFNLQGGYGFLFRSDFFFLHQNQNVFLEKNHNPHSS
jgi:hypothetical protein